VRDAERLTTLGDELEGDVARQFDRSAGQRSRLNVERCTLGDGQPQRGVRGIRERQLEELWLASDDGRRDAPQSVRLERLVGFDRQRRDARGVAGC